jgi:hypothetical protein
VIEEEGRVSMRVRNRHSNMALNFIGFPFVPHSPLPAGERGMGEGLICEDSKLISEICQIKII